MVADRHDGKTVNVAIIQKDRSDNINGKEIRMPKFDDFKKHFDALNLGGEHFNSMESRDSESLYEGFDESGFDMELKRRTILCEEIAELLKKHHPSQSVEDKQKRADLLENIFGTRSWTAVESMKSDTLKTLLIDLKSHLEPANESNQ